MDLKPITLISSVEHLELYDEIIKNATFKNKFFYNYPMPDYFPRADNQPLAYFSSGEINLRKNEFAYQSKELKIGSFRKHFLSKIYNLEELSFVLNPSQIKSIEWYYYKHPRAFEKWQYIMIICDKDIMNGDFLIRIDGESNQRLFEMLTQFKDGLEVTTSLKDSAGTKIIKLGYLGIFFLFISTIAELITFIKFGTLNYNIGGPLSGILFTLGFLMLFLSGTWCLIKSRQNSRIRQHLSNFLTLAIIIFATGNIISHFYS